jgi:hypothetical protein
MSGNTYENNTSKISITLCILHLPSVANSDNIQVA